MSVVLFRLRDARSARQVEHLQRVLAESSRSLMEGSVVVVEDGRYRVRLLPPGRSVAADLPANFLGELAQTMLPRLKPIPIKDRVSFVFLEMGNLDVLDGAFVLVDIKGIRTHIPVGGVSCLMLEPFPARAGMNRSGDYRRSLRRTVEVAALLRS